MRQLFSRSGSTPKDPPKPAAPAPEAQTPPAPAAAASEPAAPAPANPPAAASAASAPAAPDSVLRAKLKPTPPVKAPQTNAQSAEYIGLRVRLHQKLLDMMNLQALEVMKPEEIRRDVTELVRELLQQESAALNIKEQQQLISDILDEVLGLGPLEPLLKDSTVSDILVNTHACIYVERKGRLELTPVRFKDDRHLMRIIDKIVSSVGRRVDESTPMVDARLKDGSRVNAVVPPLAVDGPLLSIRKFGTIRPNIQDLINAQSMTPQIAHVLKGIVECRLNVLISGGTGSGKTTMLNAMSSFINDRERVITIEDAAELQLQQPHVARLETRPSNIEGRGEISQRDLVKNSLRMRPDRIILGECRSGEAFDMLQAMNTGHDGSMTTIHANTCRDALSRLEQMIAMAGFDLPIRGMRQQIAAAVHVVLQLERLSDGRRKLTSLHEVTGMEGDIITMQEIFRFQRRTVDDQGNVVGDFRATGIRPKFTAQMKERGIDLPTDLFRPDHALG
jgi:pilus assembly protein CpaF